MRERKRVRTVVAVLYCTGVAVFLVGVATRIVAGMWNLDDLGTTGALLNAGAWPIAVAGAIVDIRHRRHLARLEEAGEAGEADEADEAGDAGESGLASPRSPGVAVSESE